VEGASNYWLGAGGADDFQEGGIIEKKFRNSQMGFERVGSRMRSGSADSRAGQLAGVREPGNLLTSLIYLKPSPAIDLEVKGHRHKRKRSCIMYRYIWRR